MGILARSMAALKALLLVAIVAAAHGVEDAREHLEEDIAEVKPFFDSIEMIQIQGMMGQAKEALKSKLAADARAAHLAKLEVEQTAKHTKARSAAATAEALKHPSVKSAKKAKKANAEHKKVLKHKAKAQAKAKAALKKAHAAGAKVKLPTLAAIKRLEAAPKKAKKAAAAPAKKLPPIPKVAKDPGPTNLEKVLKQRRAKRLAQEAHQTKRAYLKAEVDAKTDAIRLADKMAKYQADVTQLDEAKTAKSAAQKSQRLGEANLAKARTEEHLDESTLKQVQRAEGLAKANLREAKVEEQVANALAESGGASVHLKKAAKRRKSADSRVTKAAAGIVAAKKAVTATKAQTAAAKATVVKVQTKIAGIRHRMHRADKKYADALYTIHHDKHKREVDTENKDQALMEDKLAKKKLHDAHELATATALRANNDAKAQMAHFKALALNPKAARDEALKDAQDQDGISNKGFALVAKDGEIEAMFKKKFYGLHRSGMGPNPLTAAAAAAAVRPENSGAAQAALPAAPTSATIAKAKANVRNLANKHVKNPMGAASGIKVH